MNKVKTILTDVGIIILGVVVVTTGIMLAGYFNKPVIDNLSAIDLNDHNLVGSSTDLERVPDIYVKANTTTTDSTYDGGLVTQAFRIDGVKTIRLFMSAVSSYATNTLDIRPEVSFDGTNYFKLMHSTSTPNMYFNGTTTPSINTYVTRWYPGTATTTWSFDYDVEGAQFVRFLIKGSEEADIDHKEGTQAWITAVAIETY
jgi:hypothetical protein